MTDAHMADGFDWGGLAEQFGLVEYGVESLEERLQAVVRLPEVAASTDLQAIVGGGFGGHLEYLAKVLSRVDAELAAAFELFGPKVQGGNGFVGWQDFKAIAGGWTPPWLPKPQGGEDK
jgi:hypothetical protein